MNREDLRETMYESFKTWSTHNFESTLSNHGEEIENLLEKIEILDIWSNALQSCTGAKKLMPEIFIDMYMSVHYACMGLYKYAYACLRSQLETALRLVYFSTHPIEFEWWLHENEWYRSGLKTKDVWGAGYTYFENLDFIKKFDKKCGEGEKLFSNGNKIRKIYSKLSKYVHSSATSFQTSPNRFSPKYSKPEFKIWSDTFLELQDYINMIFVLSFLKEFKNITSTEKERILDVGIYTEHYRNKIKEIVEENKD